MDLTSEPDKAPLNMQIAQKDSTNTSLITQAYLAPQYMKTFYRPHNARFWTAVAVLILGMIITLGGFMFLFRLSSPIAFMIIGFGTLLGWPISRWIDSRLFPKPTRLRKQKIVGGVGLIAVVIVMVVIILLNPGLDFRKWYLNPFVLPAAWSMFCGIYFQVTTAIEQSLIENPDEQEQLVALTGHKQ